MCVQYSVDILLCKSAFRRLFFPSCSITVFCTLSSQFVWFGLDSGLSFALRSCGSYHVVWNWAGSALLSGSPKSGTG